MKFRELLKTDVRELFARKPCGHEAEIGRLLTENDGLERSLGFARASNELLSSQLAAANGSMERMAARILELNRQHTSALISLEDSGAALEEATSQIAILQEQLHARGGKQLELPVAPASDDGSVPFEVSVVDDTTTTVTWQIVGLFFADRRKWLVRRPGEKQIFKVSIKDPQFFSRIHDREQAFTDGDVLRTKTRTVVTRVAPETDSVEHTIVEVLSVINQPQHEQPALAASAAAEGVTTP